LTDLADLFLKLFLRKGAAHLGFSWRAGTASPRIAGRGKCATHWESWPFLRIRYESWIGVSIHLAFEIGSGERSED
jgi:hypothetical protein